MAEETATPASPIRVSVCMATYNGSQYIEEQLRSILDDLGPHDEVVAVDDCSTDDTVGRIESLSDARVTVVRSAVNRGYVRAFEDAVGRSRGQFVLLSDQDDVWILGRAQRLVEALESNDVVASNFDVLGGGTRPPIPRLRSEDSKRHFANLFGTLIGYRAYYGSAMGMTRRAVSLFLPIPDYVRESHDLWLAICGNMAGVICHMDEPTLLRRLHAENVTPRGWRSLRKIVAARVMLVRLIAEAFVRVRSWERGPSAT